MCLEAAFRIGARIAHRSRVTRDLVNSSLLPKWSLAARIAFAISPNSASCERIFSLLEEMYGDQQMHALADQLRAAIMLAFSHTTNANLAETVHSVTAVRSQYLIFQ